MPSKEKQRSSQIRQLLIESTIKMFNQYGHAVTTDAICADAGVGKGTLFNYFQSKDKLLYATHLYCHDHGVQISEANIDWEASEETVVKQLLRQAARWAFDFPQEVLYTGNYNRSTQTDLMNVDTRPSVKGIIDDKRILNRLMAFVPASFPKDYLSVTIANQNYQFCLYLARHPECRKDTLFLEQEVEWTWRSIDILREIR